MIYAKINIEGSVEEFPLTSDQIRSRCSEVSLPFVLEEDSLPFGYVIVKTSDLKNIETKFKNKIESKIPVKSSQVKYYTIDITDDKLNDRELEEGKLTPLGNKKLLKYQLLTRFIDGLADRIVDRNKISQTEKSTWDLQFKEALNWSKDPLASTPVLDIIGTARGVDLSLLKQKALAKALQYQATVSYIVGRKQAWEDMIDRAASEQEVDSISFDITLEEIETATNYYLKR